MDRLRRHRHPAQLQAGMGCRKNAHHQQLRSQRTPEALRAQRLEDQLSEPETQDRLRFPERHNAETRRRFMREWRTSSVPALRPLPLYPHSEEWLLKSAIAPSTVEEAVLRQYLVRWLISIATP